MTSLPLVQVELQGVSLVVLSFFREEEEAVKLADLVKEAGGILGAAVCCAENGGAPKDDWTTCDRDRDLLLDRCRQHIIAVCVLALHATFHMVVCSSAKWLQIRK